MPKIYEYLSLVFRFYSNDHAPIHVHVRKSQKECKCELIFEKGKLSLQWKKVKGKKPLPLEDMKTAGKFIVKYQEEIVTKWNEVFVYNRPVKMEKITKL